MPELSPSIRSAPCREANLEVLLEQVDSLISEASANRQLSESLLPLRSELVDEAGYQAAARVYRDTTVGIATLDFAGTVLDSNPAFRANGFFNLKAGDDLTGKPFWQAVNLEAGELADVVSQVANGEPWSGKATAGEEAPQQRAFWLSLTPSYNAEQETLQIVAVLADISDLELTQSQLRQQALFDNLTGLPNRRYFSDELERVLELAKRKHFNVSVCFLDLDDFKNVNDSTGHATGDRLLQTVGKRIAETVGDRGFVSRFGGDEFALILTSEGNHDSAKLSAAESGSECGQRALAILVVDELLQAFREPFRLLEAEVVIGLSIGITCFPEHGETGELLMCNADTAMYVAKEAGKNQRRVFSPQMQDRVMNRHSIRSKLRQAILEREITLYFQPKACASSGAIVGCEALARWRTPEGNFIPPSDFVPIAEQTGLIVPLGELVLRLAAEKACEWQAAGTQPAIAVNVSPRQLRHPRFVETLKATLAETGAQPEWFELEITEYAMMEDVEQAICLISQLDQLGFRIAIDDFGTGYSSLSYLKNFRIHTLKVDLSFTRDVTHDPQSEAIVRSIVSLGTGLGLTTVAEGVETTEQAELLQKIGCTVLQGYWIGKPMPGEDYPAWLAQRAADAQPAETSGTLAAELASLS